MGFLDRSSINIVTFNLIYLLYSNTDLRSAATDTFLQSASYICKHYSSKYILKESELPQNPSADLIPEHSADFVNTGFCYY